MSAVRTVSDVLNILLLYIALKSFPTCALGSLDGSCKTTGKTSSLVVCCVFATAYIEGRLKDPVCKTIENA